MGLLVVAVLAALWSGARHTGRPALPRAVPEPEALADRAAPPELAAAARPAGELAGPAEPDEPQRVPAPADEAPPERVLTARMVCADLSPAEGRALAVTTYASRRGPQVQQELVLDAQGRFELPLESDWIGARLGLALADHARFDRHVDLPPSEARIDLGTILLSAGGRVAGLVRGLPRFEGWGVTVMPRDAAMPSFLPRRSAASVLLDEEGRFSIEHLPPGPIALTLHHKLLGTVAERELVVLELGTTFFEHTYTGGDPERSIFVQVEPAGMPGPQEIWLTDELERTHGATRFGAGLVVFEELTEGSYTLTSIRSDQEPFLRRGLRPGQRVAIPWKPLAGRTSAVALQNAQNARLGAALRIEGRGKSQSILWNGEEMELPLPEGTSIQIVPAIPSSDDAHDHPREK
jgi:hypothetical protein